MASLQLVVVLTVFFALKCFSQRSPTISYISQQQVKDVGGIAELSCSVQYTDNFPVLWMKADKQGSYSLPISTGSSLILHESRYSLRYDAESTTYTLQIRDIQETDAGFYFCQILISSSNRVSAEVELQVRRPPYISDNSTRSVVTSEGGKSIIPVCPPACGQANIGGASQLTATSGALLLTLLLVVRNFNA